MMHALLGSFRRSLVACAALGLPITEQGCTLLDDDYSPALVEPAASAPSGDDVEHVDVAAMPASTPPLLAKQEPSREGPVLDALAATHEEGPAIAALDDAAESPETESPAAEWPAAESPDAGPLAARPPPPPPPSSVTAQATTPPIAPCAVGLGTFGAPERVIIDGLNAEVRAPSLTADGKTLYFAASVAGADAIYHASRSSVESTVFETPVAVSELGSTGILSGASESGTPFISSDAQRLYFYSDRVGSADWDLWRAERDPRTGRFATPVALTELNERGYDLLPWLAVDELSIAFVSTRPTRTGTSDLYFAVRPSRNSAFGPPAPLTELNAGGDEGRLVLTADALTVFFSSDRNGTADLFGATRPEPSEPFSAPVSLDILNSTATDHDVALSADGRELFFASTRDGASALWRAARTCG